MPSQTTSITIDGVTKTIYLYGFEPQKLAALEDSIDKSLKLQNGKIRKGPYCGQPSIFWIQ